MYWYRRELFLFSWNSFLERKEFLLLIYQFLVFTMVTQPALYFPFTLGVSKLCIHQKYNERTMDFDIALLHLSKPVNYSDAVSPICMPSSSWNSSNTSQCYVTGWGQIREAGPTSDKLRVAQVPIIEHNECKKMYQGKSLTRRMLCAGYKQGRIDSCQGDSGGPLACWENGAFVLAGAVSWGFGCAQRNQPGVYANIPYFQSWIDLAMRNG